MGLGKSTDFNNGFAAGVAKGKLDMYRTVVDMFFDIQEWADLNIEHDDDKEYCEICTLLDHMQLKLLLMGQEQGRQGVDKPPHPRYN